MQSLNRREFMKTSSASAMGLAVASAFGKSPAETINIAVAGIRNRGRAHYRNFLRLPNVRVTALCDIDERLFPKAVSEVKEMSGQTPQTVVDYRELLDNKEIDAIAIATPDHWHALQTIWACQAGKDVYVEKPLAYTIQEGRKMVEAARKYNRIVQVGTQHVSDPVVRKGIQFIREGKLGEIYSAGVIVYGHRPNIGRVGNSEIPPGVHWDLFLGPAPMRPFNENRFHYKWHWFWDTSTTEFGNNGVHMMDMIRRSLDKRQHPEKIHCTGGFYVYDSDQEIPNLQMATFEYGDGVITELTVRSLYTNPEAGMKSGCFFYGSEGWMQMAPGQFKSFFGPKDEPGLAMTRDDLETVSFEIRGLEHFQNFIDCVRSRKVHELNADVLEGHLSTTICHLGNIAYRTERKLEFNAYAEKFVNDPDADRYLSRQYRPPFDLPDQI